MSDVTDLDPAIEAPAVETPAVAPAPVVEAPKTSDKTGLRDTLIKVSREVNAKNAEKEAAKAADKPEGRDEHGRFVPKVDKPAAPQQAKPITTEKPLEGVQPGAEQPKKADAAPGTWRAEAKAEWDKLPANTKSEILRRESDFSRENGKFQQQIQQINQTYGPIEQLIGPRRAGWKLDHGSEAKALETLLNYSDLAGSDPTTFLARYLSNPDVASRVDLQKVFGERAPGDDIMRHPVVQELQKTVTGLNERVSGFMQTQQTNQLQTIEQQIASYRNAVDDKGAPLRPHFSAVEQDIFNLIPAIKSQFPNDPVEKIMDRAYNVAIRTNSTVSGEVQRADEDRIRNDMEAKARVAKAALANKSVPPGAPPPGHVPASPGNANDLRAELKRNFQRYANGESARI